MAESAGSPQPARGSRVDCHPGRRIRQPVAAIRETFEAEGNFVRATAHWPIDSAAPGSYHATAILYDEAGGELGRVASRLVSVNWAPGY